MIQRYAIIEAGLVANVTLAEPDFAAAQGWTAAPDQVGPGWQWDGEQFMPPVPEPEPVPEKISDWQFFQQLANMGVITQAEALAAVGPGVLPASMNALIEALPTPMQFPVRILLTGAVTFERNHPMTPVLGGAFGWDDVQLDAVWRDGAAL